LFGFGISGLGFQPPPVFWIVSAAAFGAVVGSFCNVCIHRLPRRCLSVVRPRSRCPACLAPIAWYDNLPVLSWLLLGAKCRRCRAPIGWRYPAVELLTAGLFAAAAAVELADPSGPAGRLSPGLIVIHAALLAALVVATFIDAEFRIIPDEITKPGIVAGLLASAAVPEIQRMPLHVPGAGDRVDALATALLGAAWGWGMLKAVQIFGEIAFARTLKKLGTREAMGLGDVKFMAMLGAFLGPHAVTLIFFMACLIGSVVGIVRLLFTRDHYIAFGPFLAVAAGAMVLAGNAVLEAVAGFLRGY
jgi:leader peptidase (prepilin peptidase)/N-methyltransferase